MATTFEDTVEVIKILFGDVTIEDEWITLGRPIPLRDGGQVSRIKVSEIIDTSARIDSATVTDDVFLTWGNECEVMILDNGRGGGPFTRSVFREGFNLESGDENDLSFSLGKPSLAYLLFLLRELNSSNAVNVRRHPLLSRMRVPGSMRVNSALDGRENTDATLEEAIATLLPYPTLRIKSPNARSDFRPLCESFLFTLAYNYDSSFLIPSGFGAISRASRIERVRRARGNEIDAPRMTYKSDLVHHYQLGVSAESPLLAYLSFYHVAEHFFEKVYSDDLIDQVRAKIADPAFSLKRARDVSAVIKVVSSAQRKTRDEGGVDELKALTLVFKKFVDLGRLVGDLDKYDPSIIQHYKTAIPSFSDANTVDLRGAQRDEVISSLAKRIYKTRNSLVHAKDGARPKYFPFTNDEELARDVPLMRFCAEQIIISDGKII